MATVSPSSARRISAARNSWSKLAGENAHEIAIALTSPAQRPAKRLISSGSSGAISRPSYSKPPWAIIVGPRIAARRSAGHAEPGFTEYEPGAASRSTPTRSRPRRWMMALAGWVVPSIAWAMRDRSTVPTTPSMALRMPSSGSGVVGTLIVARTAPEPSTTTASVLVPPTSMPRRRDPFMRPCLRRAHSPVS